MKLGFSIFLLALGAILTFAIDYTVAGLNINIVGWILMGAGVVGLILTMLVIMPRDRRNASSAPATVTTSTSTPESVQTPPTSVS
jgi:hypothetical protein